MRLFLAIILILIIGSCNPPTPSAEVIQTAIQETQDATNKPIISEIFRTQLNTFLTEGTKLRTMTDQGVTYAEFKMQVANTLTAYDLLLATWPEDLPVDSQSEFDKACEGWRLTIEFWDLEIENWSYPSEPDLYGYDLFVEYAGDQLLFETYSSEYFDFNKRNKKYLPWKGNKEVLVAIAGEHFELGKLTILQQLE